MKYWVIKGVTKISQFKNNFNKKLQKLFNNDETEFELIFASKVYDGHLEFRSLTQRNYNKKYRFSQEIYFFPMRQHLLVMKLSLHKIVSDGLTLTQTLVKFVNNISFKPPYAVVFTNLH